MQKYEKTDNKKFLDVLERKYQLNYEAEMKQKEAFDLFEQAQRNLGAADA
jgi:hypothetical protein